MSAEIPKTTFAPTETPIEELPDNVTRLLPAPEQFQAYTAMAGLDENVSPETMIPDPNNPGDIVLAGRFIARELKRNPHLFFLRTSQEDDPSYGSPQHNRYDCVGEDSPQGVHGHDWPN